MQSAKKGGDPRTGETTGLPRGGVGGKRGPEPSWEAGGAVHTLRLFPRGRPLLLCHSPTGWCTQKNRKKKINIKAERARARERERWHTEMPVLGGGARAAREGEVGAGKRR